MIVAATKTAWFIIGAAFGPFVIIGALKLLVAVFA